MKTTQKAVSLFVLMTMVVLSLSGCGTVKKSTDDSSDDKEAAVAPKTTINAAQVKVSSFYISGPEETVSPNTVVAVYSNIPFSAATLVGTDVSTADEFGNGGAFVIDISGCANDTFYVVATAQGFSTSDPIVVQK